jgi:hypothetical protein
MAAGLHAFVYLRRAGKQRLWFAASGLGSSSHRFEGMCPAVSGEKFAPAETPDIRRVAIEDGVGIRLVSQYPISPSRLGKLWCKSNIARWKSPSTGDYLESPWFGLIPKYVGVKPRLSPSGTGEHLPVFKCDWTRFSIDDSREWDKFRILLRHLFRIMNLILNIIYY